MRADDPHALDRILEALAYLGAATKTAEDARFAPAEADGILPDEFYSTTNFDTLVRVERHLGPRPGPEDGLRPRPARRRAVRA